MANLPTVFGAESNMRQTFFLGYVVCSNTGVHYGTGQHRSDISPENYATAKRVRRDTPNKCRHKLIGAVLVDLLHFLRVDHDDGQALFRMATITHSMRH